MRTRRVVHASPKNTFIFHILAVMKNRLLGLLVGFNTHIRLQWIALIGLVLVGMVRFEFTGHLFDTTNAVLLGFAFGVVLFGLLPNVVTRNKGRPR